MILPPLIHGRFLKRYQRFLVDVQLDDGQIITAHCPNSGSMMSCLEPMAEVFLSYSNNPQRKLPYTWEMIKINGIWVGINTNVPNRLIYELLQTGAFTTVPKLENIRREVVFGDSRFDIFGEDNSESWYIEVKNVTLNDSGVARFPDAKTLRGQKHLKTLMEVMRQGHNAAMIYVIQRTDVHAFAPAWDIDPIYSKLLLEAFESGVKIIPVQYQVTPDKITPKRVIPFLTNR
ncbi:MAG TPA: DNA/RNA nuclease SfsA [Salinivirgaceae bacterium]|nr:DNA/RNA nuclease SfsA [Salinivirgaceae bacterium]